MTLNEILILGTYFFVLVILAVYGWHRYYLVYLYMKNKASVPVPSNPLTELPPVTIQLPIYNEMYVADRLIDAVCQIDYPRELLEIQVLDDSTDESRQMARAKVEALRKHPPAQSRPGRTRSASRAAGRGS
jgi:cellulose synthase/poly-beta-1,6-N-acetylglucosamine synthase-like glycosyltransferase